LLNLILPDSLKHFVSVLCRSEDCSHCHQIWAKSCDHRGGGTSGLFHQWVRASTASG